MEKLGCSNHMLSSKKIKCICLFATENTKTSWNITKYRMKGTHSWCCLARPGTELHKLVKREIRLSQRRLSDCYTKKTSTEVFIYLRDFKLVNQTINKMTKWSPNMPANRFLNRYFSLTRKSFFLKKIGNGQV